MEITDDDLKELLEAAKGMFNGSLSHQPGEWIKFSNACQRLERAIEKVEGSVGVNKPTKGETRWEV
jgi:hypothetical protein|tara:strand:+ start:384 stop:581 length:198 start_codon:yes stop_codon:yes gene_type:complete